MKKLHWRSLDELADTPEFREMLHREFPQAASELPTDFSRRRWLQLMGASLVLGGVGCTWEEEKIAPYAVRPANRTPGVPEFYSTAYEWAGIGRPLEIKTYDGRPIKVEGNPRHPASQGATSVFEQAAILELYDPDRSRKPREKLQQRRYERDWSDFDNALLQRLGELKTNNGRGLSILTDASSSPTRQRLLSRIQKRFPSCRLYEYEPLSVDNLRQGAKLAFGQPVRTILNWTEADILLTLDADPMADHPDALRLVREWSARRTPETADMNRLYAVESQFTVTGSVADHRLPLRSSHILGFVSELERRVRNLMVGEASETSSDQDFSERMLNALAQDLVSHKGRSCIIAGRVQSPEVHAIVHRLNDLLENVGRSIRYCEEPDPERKSHLENIQELVQDISQGNVDTLFILGANPVYSAPSDLQFSQALRRVPFSIHFGLREDETGRECQWHLPRSHPFEAWSDTRCFDGAISIGQPLILPLHDSRSDLEVLALFSGDQTPDGQKLVRATLESLLSKSSGNSLWETALHDGLVKETGYKVVKPALKSFATSGSQLVIENEPATLEVVFTPSPSVYDGRYANNGWLQETPAPLTKLTWDNAAIIAPQTANRLKVQHGQMLRITLNSRQLEIPAFILPGQADGSIGIALGYGRTAAGVVGGDTIEDVKPVGFNAQDIRTSSTFHIGLNAEVQPLSTTHTLATTQTHFAIDKVGLEEMSGRIGDLVREGTLGEFQKDPDFAEHKVHHPPLNSLWEERPRGERAWGMSIDLSRCIGCNACMVACQSENNVPVVGKDQVEKGREMHWLRMDQYFVGEPDSPQIAHQPVACHHCENAPCEQVCPVAATVHSTEGLNDMVYNRCVGTRYCANNCPYKVRRFNFLDYNQNLEAPQGELVQLAMNPDVSIRSRGVMEKCTYCVQRIQSSKITAHNERRPIADGEVQTACQQACPAQAIEFGDLQQTDSRVSQAHANARAYAMLAELNVKPRTKYLARIRNPHPDLADDLSDSDAHSEHAHSEART